MNGRMLIALIYDAKKYDKIEIFYKNLQNMLYEFIEGKQDLKTDFQ